MFIMKSITKKILLVFILFSVILSIMQFTVPSIIGFDGYLNIKVAEIIRDEGLLTEFPYVENIILNDDYSDIQILFRIFLIPFTFLGLTLGAKIFTILMGAVCFTVFYWFLYKNKIRYPLFFSLFYLFSAETLMYRFMLPRQMPLLITFLILTLYFLQKRRYIALGIVSYIYVLIHSGFVIQLFLISAYFVIDRVFSKKFDYKLIFYGFIGSVLGIILNPYFPGNISLLYTQIFEVNLLSNLFNVEWKPWSIIEFVKFNFSVAIFFVFSLFVLVRNKKINKNQAFFLVSSLLFLVLTITSRRMQEYLIPFSLLMLVFFLKDYMKKVEISKQLKISTIILLLVLAGFNYNLLRQDIKNNSFFSNYDNCISFMNSEIPEGSRIFNNAYAFSYLFFNNDNLRYSHGIDLTYSYLHDKEKFERYMKILQGELKEEKDYIVEDYNPDYLFVGKIKQDVQLFNYIISHGENYKVLFEDDWCAVLEVV